MTRADNSAHLVRAAALRHDQAVERTRAAVESLDRTGRTLTFAAVAQAAGVSRSWLYRQPAIRDAILRCRQRDRLSATVPSPERATAASLRERVEDLRAEAVRLREENAHLHGLLARRLGERRLEP